MLEVEKALLGDEEIVRKYPAIASLAAVVTAWKDENRYLRLQIPDSSSIEKVILPDTMQDPLIIRVGGFFI